jgi:hypothetical protein
MDASVRAEIDQLSKMKTAGLRAKYQEVFGLETRSSNKQFLFRRIAWRLQARAEGDLCERARNRAAELADDAEIRVRAPKGFFATAIAQKTPAALRSQPQRDWRLPPTGTVLTRRYRGQTFTVHVDQDGFEYQGQHYRSLSAIARQITGTRWNGLAFFHLTERHRG